MIVCLSVRLKELRTSKKLTQKQVSQIVGVTRSVISAYESNIRQPSYEILIRLAAVYGVSTDYLLCVEGKRYLDISALTDEEASVIFDMVNLLIKTKMK